MDDNGFGLGMEPAALFDAFADSEGQPMYLTVFTTDVIHATTLNIRVSNEHLRHLIISEPRAEFTPEAAYDQLLAAYDDHVPLVLIWWEHKHCSHIALLARINEPLDPDKFFGGDEFGFDNRSGTSVDDMLESLLAAAQRMNERRDDGRDTQQQRQAMKARWS